MLVMSLDAPGTGLTHPPASTLAIRQRLRVAVQGPDGNLYVVTDGDGGSGGIWRVVPL
jgi:glucose/arabinose dehydrogenase